MCPSSRPGYGESMSGTEQQQSEERQKAQEAQERHEKARAKMDELEENPPEKLEDWPDDKAK